MKKNILVGTMLSCILVLKSNFNTKITWPWQKKQPQKHDPIIYNIGRPNNTSTLKIKLVQGDLLHVSATKALAANEPYSIVNTANKFLYLGGGIAGAIKNADQSGMVQNACNELLNQYGKQLKNPVEKSTGFFNKPKIFNKYMPVGSAWLTKSGDLKNNQIEHIIHAVCPDCRQEQEQSFFEDFLRMAYGNIITVIIDYNIKNNTEPIKTIACPSLATGIFNCPIQKSAGIAAEMIFTIFSHLATTDNKHTPTTFIMVAYSDKDFQAYKEAFNAISSKKTALQHRH